MASHILFKSLPAISVDAIELELPEGIISASLECHNDNTWPEDNGMLMFHGLMVLLH